MDAIRAHIAHFGGYEALTSETLWSEVIPVKPINQELAVYYGQGYMEPGAASSTACFPAA